jgi:hypothetical protein
VEDPAPPAAPPTAHWGRHTGFAALALGAWLLLLEVSVELWFRTAERSQLAQSPTWTLQLPRQKLEFSEPAIPPVVPKLLQYDEGRRAQWRDDRGHPWQMYYMRWATAQNRFRAAGSLIQAGHNTDICLQNVGMVHQTNFPPEILRQGPVPMRFQAQRFVASGTPYYIASAYWTPAGSPEPATKFVAAGSLYAMRRATDALRRRDRGWLEQRVIKIAAVDLESDAVALPALRETVLGLVQPQAAPPIQTPPAVPAP